LETEPYGARRILFHHKKVSIVTGKFLAQTTALMQSHTSAHKIIKLAKPSEMKEFIYIQERDSQKMRHLNYQIKNYTLQLKKNSQEFLVLLMQHPHSSL